MRSEERAGIVFAALLLLWGTRLTEPLRIFVTMMYVMVCKVINLFGFVPEGKYGVAVIVLSFTAFVIVALKLSQYKIAQYYPCILMALTTLYYISTSVTHKTYDHYRVLALCIALGVVAVLYMLKFDKLLTWASDICVISPLVYLIVGLIFMPIRGLLGENGKYIFVANRQDVDLAYGFTNFLHLPALVWGIFIAILLMLPVVYICFLRGFKKSK